MAVNLRGRTPELRNGIAGNYIGVVVYRAADYATPGLIRKSLSRSDKLVRAATPASALPSIRERICGSTTNVTNWTTFHREVRLAGTRPTNHSKFVPDRLPFENSCVIYRPVKDKVNISTLFRENAHYEALERLLPGVLARIV